MTKDRWRALLELTQRLGVLTDRSHDVPRTDAARPARVVVDGCGDVASEIVAALVRSHVTVVHGRAAVDRAVAAPHHPRPDLVVLVGSPVVDPRRGDLWLRHRIPHLPVTPAGPRTVVGPLVDGSPDAPCLWCLDRHRADRDDAWPTVMSQAAPTRQLALTGPPRRTARRPRARADAARRRQCHAARHGAARGAPATAGSLRRGEPPVAPHGPPSLADAPALRRPSCNAPCRRQHRPSRPARGDGPDGPSAPARSLKRLRPFGRTASGTGDLAYAIPRGAACAIPHRSRTT